MFWRLFASSNIEDYLHGENAWAVVTGSTNGIGKATADVLLSKGFNVLIHGRNPTKIQATLRELGSKYPSRRVESVLADFNKLDDVQNIPNYITANNLRVTVFINNAAPIDNDLFLFEEMPENIVDKTLNVGIVFFTKLCYKILPILKGVDGPTLMANIGSMSREIATPFIAIYAGTKGYILSFTRILASEAVMTSSNVCHLYIDTHAVATPDSHMPESTFVPSPSTFAESLVYSLGMRSNRKRGGDVLITPYWAHELQGYSMMLVPKQKLQKLLIDTMVDKKTKQDNLKKRSD